MLFSVAAVLVDRPCGGTSRFRSNLEVRIRFNSLGAIVKQKTLFGSTPPPLLS